MRVLLLVPVVAIGLLPAAAGAKDIAARDVRLTDSALAPVEASIAVNDSVRWLNQGAKPHTIVSDTRAWTSFTLRPRKSRSVRFTRAGCYRYKVDGKMSGRVAVSASCGGTGTSPPPPPSTGPTIYRYDITVTGDAHTVQRISGDTRPPDLGNNTNGTIDVELVWKSIYRNVAFKKTTVSSDVFTLVPAGSLFARGTTNIVFSYNHAREGVWGPCRGNFSMKTLASRTSLTGSRGPPLGNTFSFSSQMLNGPAETVSKRVRSECPKYSDEPVWIESRREYSYIVRGGLTWTDVSDPITLVTVQVERKSPRIFSPLDRLSQGDGFTIQTGAIRNESRCAEGGPPFCAETFTGSLVVKFVPRRR